ncbi:unnamed protein product [Dicrocoelium dendriticum]|nr:unnamed protein product [Dicrocoelium dendriticum]
MDPEQVMEDGSEVLQFIRNYWNGILQNQFPVLPDFSTIKPGYLQNLIPREAPEEGEEMVKILDDCKKMILPGVTHWQHPDFHAYYPAATSTASILGDLLSGSLGVVPLTWTSSPAATELEVIVLNWLAKALGLPSKFLYNTKQHSSKICGSGVIEITTGIASLIVTIAIRNSVTKRYRQEADLTEDNPAGGAGTIVDRMVAYVSDQVNCSIQRAVDLAMIQIRTIKSKRIGCRLVFDAADIQKEIQTDRERGFIPLMCIASLGTTNTCEFDNLQEIGTLCQKENIWLHVDAAYAGSALLCPEFRHFAQGLEFADSICFNPHKLMLVNFDCAILWVSNYKLLTSTFGMEAVYLQSGLTGMPDFKVIVD